MSRQAKTLISEAEYLERERAADFKSEYYQGEVWPMTDPPGRANVLAESGMSTQPRTLMSEAEYLERERAAEFKSEYYRGEVFAMAGAREPHNTLATNMIGLLHQLFRRRPCRVYGSDLRVHIPANTLYTYPDVSALCGEPQFLDASRDTLLNPTFIAEILSDSTEQYDRGQKFELYRSIESLREYLLVSSDRVHADLYTRQPTGQWLLTSFGRLEEEAVLESIGCRLALADLYEKVELPEPRLR